MRIRIVTSGPNIAADRDSAPTPQTASALGEER
jgi:hypothetical protein